MEQTIPAGYAQGAKGTAWSCKGETVMSQIRDWLWYERPESAAEADVDLAFNALVESDLVVVTDHFVVEPEWHFTSYVIRDLAAAKRFVNAELRKIAQLKTGEQL